MGPEIFLLLILQIKHWFVDFVNQTELEIKSKSVYGDRAGVLHSIKHGVGTFGCVWIVLGIPGILMALLMGIIDTALHYHIDWTKSNYGCIDDTKKEFWIHFGLDQLGHQITYIIILGIVLL